MCVCVCVRVCVCVCLDLRLRGATLLRNINCKADPPPLAPATSYPLGIHIQTPRGECRLNRFLLGNIDRTVILAKSPFFGPAWRISL
jgi:hypothetical protein